MTKTTALGTLTLLVALAACDDSPVAPTPPQPSASVGAAVTCPLAPVPAGATVVLCFNTTLIPGVWHGWIMALSDGPAEGAMGRARLNHPYVLASPQGHIRWGDSDLSAPGAGIGNVYAFQREFFVDQWIDVLRLVADVNGPPKDVAVVVYWADAPTAAADLGSVVSELKAAGSLNGGQANALTKKLDQTLKLVEKGKVAEAMEVLEGLIQQVKDLRDNDILTAEEADKLISRAEYLLTVITPPSP